jgi:hemoglobin
MSSRIILILASAFLVLNTSCSLFESKPEGTETAEAAAKKDADNIATDAGLDIPPVADGAPANSAKASSPVNEKSLYDRIGGKEMLAKFSDKFVDAMAANPKLLANPKVAEAMKKDQSKHKASMTEYLCQVSGGPCKYKGPSMKDAHHSMGVTSDEWRAMGGIFIKTLRELNVPKNERKELANLASMSKPDVVGQ